MALLARVDEVARFCRDNAAEVDHEGGFPVEEFRLLGRAGLLAAPLPRAYGGAGLGTEVGSTHAVLLLLARLGWGSLSVGRVYEGHLNALQLVRSYGTPEQLRAVASEVHNRQALLGVWNTEAADGVTARPLIRDRDRPRFRLAGTKTFASGAGSVTHPIITGSLPEGGWQMFLVPFEQLEPTVDQSWWKPLGMRASASYRVDFEGAELDANAAIGRPGDYWRQPWFSGGAVRFAAVQVGGAEALFDATVAYLRDLERADDPHQQMRLGRMAVAVETGYRWLRGAADVWDGYLARFGFEGGWNEASQAAAADVVAYANMTRTAIEQLCLEALELAERSVGARGLIKPQPFERQVRDLRLYLRQPAPDAAQVCIAEHVIRSGKSFSELWPHEP